ncbi:MULTISPECIES: NADP-dependent oxidoreductase [Streptacidiphilus]|uniref:NADP-dependent oxidoreductase n=1 Tax=Streptacidiphilus cavernicola TaxID=3342716 RepID=A0ABV6UVJ4_9ACTN|nr:NADP-dependent oxidoreductase [Streptacidiphilus jeojiense]
MSRTFTAVRQVRRPEGVPVPEDFAVVTGTAPDLRAGQVLVQNLYLSVDPYMRGLMRREGWARGFGLEGRSLGRVVESRDPALPEGTTVFHHHGWATHAVLTGDEVRTVVAPPGVPLPAYLGVLGGTGLTAFVGLTRIARLQPGEDLFVSAAAGGVGGSVGQIARLLGAGRIIGSAGTPAKVRYLIDVLGFDAAFDYHDASVTEQLAAAAPDGIDVCFENVGGDHLEAALAALRTRGRVAWCGAIAEYNNPEDPPAAPRNLAEIMRKDLRVEGFGVRDHLDARADLEALVIPNIQAGRVRVDQTVVDGFDRIVDAFLGLLRGENTGKMLVRVAD